MMWGLDLMRSHAHSADSKRMNRAWLLIFGAGILWAIFQSVVIVKVVPAIWL